MTMRSRKLVGTLILLVFITLWAFTTMMVGLWVLKDASGLTEALFFAVTGCLWAVPAMGILKWMLKPDTPRES
ncbi:MAG: DUF2842 domain-containing protein [Pseudomonadota bacterium]